MDFPSHVNLPKETRRELVELLNANLATAVDLYTQCKQAHWNVRGREFISRHELFDTLADHVRKHSDTLAERAGQLGGYAEGTVRLAAKASDLPEYDLNAVNGDDHIRALVARFARYAASLRSGADRAEDLEDVATNDLFTQLLREAEEDLWFLESHLVGEAQAGARRGAQAQPQPAH